MPLWNNIAELMDYYIPPPPTVYWFDIIRVCNLKCVMCPQSKGLKPLRERMPVDLFRGVIDDICGNQPLVKLYLSGEPLFHEGLFEMIEYAGGKGCRTMVHTNATALTQEVAERILASSLTFLCFSFDGCSAEVYERLRPPARFEHVKSNIERYMALRRDRGGVGPRTTVEIIRMEETGDLLDGFESEWRDKGVDEVHVAEHTTWHGLVDDRGTVKRGVSPGYKPCAAPFSYGCILADGTVVPCCLDVNGRMPMGNVETSRFREIWAGGEFRQLRLEMLTGTFGPGCICERCDNTARERCSDI
ncbi:MAG TPA: radical SAM protein [Sedimentisphaerales bacterium]|jgi:MoaA/NifB/PqqE/SkfB family radical SAM enzyme|nr:radical SAM protein [Sedimentisphaerales bacterium]HNU30127.1 radical SAM protein [Sedimentisphaerales bacterium]